MIVILFVFMLVVHRKWWPDWVAFSPRSGITDSWKSSFTENNSKCSNVKIEQLYFLNNLTHHKIIRCCFWGQTQRIK